MKTWMCKAVLILAIGLGATTHAEPPTVAPGDHGNGPAARPSGKTIAPMEQAPVEDKNVRLINAINACLMNRPAAVSGSVAGSPDSALIQSALSRILR